MLHFMRHQLLCTLLTTGPARQQCCTFRTVLNYDGKGSKDDLEGIEKTTAHNCIKILLSLDLHLKDIQGL